MTRGAAAPPEPELGPYRISDREFALFQALVQRETGIQLPDSKRALLVGRLARRLRTLQLDNFGAYHERVMDDGDELVRLIDLISTNETRFFREPRQFEFLERVLLPAWAAAASDRPRRLRVWSAACSTGEEPFSIAMTLLGALPDWEFEILATDISTRVLEKARTALWPIEKSRDIPERYLKAFMLRGVGEHQGYMKAARALCERVRFQRLNLQHVGGRVDGRFDLIFCRNVLIYFSADGRAAVVRRLMQQLAPGGHLFLGHAETLNGISHGLRIVEPTVYAAPDAAGAPVLNRSVCPAPGQSLAAAEAATACSGIE